jgi:hypothetical protein
MGNGLAVFALAPAWPSSPVRRFGLRTLNGGGLALSTVGYIGLAALVSLGASQAAESPPARPPPARLSGQRIAKNR